MATISQIDNMTGAELTAMADRLEVNPYYLGYSLETGVATPQEAFARDGNGAPFMAWNSERWNEQAKAEGVPRDYVTVRDGASGRHIDFIARRLAATAAIRVTPGRLRTEHEAEVAGIEASAARAVRA